jgi:hypothetical protein
VATQLTTFYSNRLAVAGDLPTAGLRLHLRPDAGQGLATAPDGTVATWADRSGHGLVLAPASASAPTVGAWAGGTGVYLTNQQAFGPLDLGGPAPDVLTAVLMLQREAGATGIMPIHFGYGNSQDLWLDSNHFGLNTYNSDIFGIDQADAALDQPVLVVAEVHSNQPYSFRLWLNGQQQDLAQQQGTPNTRSLETLVRLGGNDRWLWRGWLGETLLYDRALTEAEQRATYETLRARYPALPAYVPPRPPLNTHAPSPIASDVPAGPLGWWSAATGLTYTPTGSLLRWDDLSGFGRTLVPGSAAPVLQNWAGSQALYFNKQQHLGPLDLGGPAPDVLTAVLLLQKEAGASSIMPIHFGSGNSQDLWLDSNHFGLNTYSSDIYGIDQADAALGQPVLVVAEVHSNQPDAFRLWLNGQPQPIAQQQGSPNTRSLETLVRLGGNPGWLWHGWIAEALLYNRPLTDAEQAQLVAYVRGRYQVPF